MNNLRHLKCNLTSLNYVDVLVHPNPGISEPYKRAQKISAREPVKS